MKERPILFSSPMVRAILDGKKTQTRRVVKPQPRWFENQGGDFGRKPGEGCWVCSGKRNFYTNSWSPDWPQSLAAISPYGNPSDRLWVREGAAEFHDIETINGEHIVIGKDIVYRADGEDQTRHTLWKSPLFMRRDDSRLTLEITGVRVERVQDISEADARAEGVLPNWCGDLSDFDPERDGFLPWWPKDGEESVEGVDPYDTLTAKEAYAMLWDSINGKKPGASWSANPWVWVVEFKRLEQNQ